MSFPINFSYLAFLSVSFYFLLHGCVFCTNSWATFVSFLLLLPCAFWLLLQVPTTCTIVLSLPAHFLFFFFLSQNMPATFHLSFGNQFSWKTTAKFLFVFMVKIHPTPKPQNLRWSNLWDSQKQDGVLVLNLTWSHHFFQQKETRNHTQSSVKPSNRKYTSYDVSIFFSLFWSTLQSTYIRGSGEHQSGRTWLGILLFPISNSKKAM